MNQMLKKTSIENRIKKIHIPLIMNYQNLTDIYPTLSQTSCIRCSLINKFIFWSECIPKLKWVEQNFN